MEKNFETRLAEASSAERLKAAKQLLKNSSLTCAWRNADGEINAAFQERNSFAHTHVIPGTPGKSECSCMEPDGKLCEHAVAAIMYCGRFKNDFKPIDDGVSNYAGLKFESLDKLAARENPKAKAQVFINAVSAFPHVPSKWENSILAVKLNNGTREYLGNLNNLRQLFFEKTLSITMKLADFSLQDQQIIRYLAINGTADSSNISLDSEQTAEFFHCLVGFDRFFRDGRRLFIHGERTEPVIMRKRENGAIRLSPGIRVENTLMPINHAKVITGRAGCWIGRQGEYFFIPATLDISWIRNFYRTGEQEFPGKIADTFLMDGKFPLPVVDARIMESQCPEVKFLLGGGFDSEKTFHLRIGTLYENGIFPLNSGRLVRKGGEYALRDECAELKLASELEMFGFEHEGDNFVIRRPEAAGIFLDQVLPNWLMSRKNICLDSSLAKLCAGGAGVPDIELRCQIISTEAGHYLMTYSFLSGSGDIPFRTLAAAARAGQMYVETPFGTVVRISGDMGVFLRGAENVMRNLNEKERTFELPFYGVQYFIHLAGKLPGACPAELFAPAGVEQKHIHDAPAHKLNAELRNYQRDGVDWLCQMTDSKFNVILADEMGLGKTLQVLALLAARKTDIMAPALVVCPASLVINWEREANKFVPDFKVAAMSGSNRDNVWEKAGTYDLIVMSYATARRDASRIRKHKFSYLILDEAQHIKNPGTANAVNCKQIIADHRVVLTGTPLENSSEDLWSIFDFLQPGMLGNFNSFRHYYSQIGTDKELQKDLAARVAPFMKRRTKAEVCQELPPKSERLVFCDMSAEQRKLYEEVRTQGNRQLALLTEGDRKAGTEIFTTLLRLRQICCHPGLLPDERQHEVPSAKFELLQELVMEHIDSGHKLLLFSQFTSLLAKISEWLDGEGIRYEYLDGATRNRQQRVDNFNNDPELPLFLLSLKAGGTGLNLTSADTVVICDPWWNPAVEMQAADRTHRIGQTRPVSSLKLLVKDSIEEKILALQEQKQEIFDNVIDNPASAGSKLTLDELRFLLS